MRFTLHTHTVTLRTFTTDYVIALRLFVRFVTLDYAPHVATHCYVTERLRCYVAPLHTLILPHVDLRYPHLLLRSLLFCDLVLRLRLRVARLRGAR